MKRAALFAAYLFATLAAGCGADGLPPNFVKGQHNTLVFQIDIADCTNKQCKPIVYAPETAHRLTIEDLSPIGSGPCVAGWEVRSQDQSVLSAERVPYNHQPNEWPPCNKESFDPRDFAVNTHGEGQTVVEIVDNSGKLVDALPIAVKSEAAAAKH
jgi:hypothetical protein